MSILAFVKANPLLTLLGLGLFGFVVLHVVWYIHPSDIQTTAELRARLHDGQPTVVEYYSNL